MAGNRTKPTALLEASGAYIKNPSRRRKNEASPREGIGKAPESPSTNFTAVWNEVVGQVCPGVLGNSDRLHLEILCRLLCEFRAEPRAMNTARLTLVSSMLAKLGMNPVDRVRLTVSAPAKSDASANYF